MAISQKDAKLLWGRAAEHCCYPGCPTKLSLRLDKSGDILLGEMAHVIGRMPNAARSDAGVGIDDSYANLILLCPTHHTLVDKAPADYPAEMLYEWKRQWEYQVEQRVLAAASTTKGNPLEDRMWVYFNFDQLLRLYKKRCPERLALTNLADLQMDGILDNNGFPRRGPLTESGRPTLFDTWPQDKARSLQQYFSGMAEELVHTVYPLDLDELWSVKKFRALLYPGAIGFANRRTFFKPISAKGEPERRRARSAANGVELGYEVAVWNMYGDTTWSYHLRGTSKILALLYIRSVEKVEEVDGLRLQVKATPLALGSV